MPPAPKTEFVNGGPFAEVSQGGYALERGGNLRDHNGKCQNEAAFAATEHYDGDYGSGPLGLANGGGTGPVGGAAPYTSIQAAAPRGEPSSGRGPKR